MPKPRPDHTDPADAGPPIPPALIGLTPCGLLLTDPAGRVLVANAAAADVLGAAATSADLVGKAVGRLLGAGDPRSLARRLVAAKGRPLEWEAKVRRRGVAGRAVRVRVASAGGGRVAWSILPAEDDRAALERALAALERAHAELDARVRQRTAELTEANRMLSEVVARRERVEQSLRESEAFTRAILDTAVEAIITIDERGQIATFNRAAERLFGYPSEEVVGRNVSALMPEPYRGEHDGYLARYLGTGERRIIGIGREVMGRRKDGTLFPLDLAVSEVRLGHRRMFTGMLRDLTDRKRLEREILEIAEREQRRIGQDLHDGLSQQLAGINFLTTALQHKLEQAGRPEASDAARITDLVIEAIRQGRGLARGLFPVEPQPGGLAHALKHLAANVKDAYGIECRFSARGNPEVDDRSVATHLYRIAQESVNNGIRHGRAKRLDVSLVGARGWVTLRVRDDGVGLKKGTSDSGAPPPGIGMRTMAHRAHLIGGTLTVAPAKKGVEVTCRVPRRRGGPTSG
ncbi:MAG TPA: PAS domain S-box protein [Humisphaera sp.]